VNRTLTIEPEAEAEIVDAAAWYDEQGTADLRARFLREVAAALDVIRDHPYRYQIIDGRVRRIRVAGFPYALIYWVSEHEVNVVACFHGHRDPSQWKARTS
jgi:plasmid stabilization system protein ParE